MTSAAPGWYHAEGDPPGTERYWDGTQWTEGPRPIGGVPPADSPPAGAGPTGGGETPGSSPGSSLPEMTYGSSPGGSAPEESADTPTGGAGDLADMGDFGTTPGPSGTDQPGTAPTSMPPIDSGGPGFGTPGAGAPIVGGTGGMGSTTPPPSGLPNPSMGAAPPAQGFYPEQSKSTTALVLSIVGFFCCGLPAAFGIWMAREEQKAIEAGRRDPSKQGMATAALIIGIISVALWLLAYGVWGLAIVFAA